MAVNLSKRGDKRYWMRWRKSGAVGTLFHRNYTIINPEFAWIVVQNPGGRANGNVFNPRGEHASIQPRAKLTVKAMGENLVLLSYQSPDGQGYGAEAGNGTLFFISRENFITIMRSRGMLTPEKWTWVNVNQFDHNHRFAIPMTDEEASMIEALEKSSSAKREIA